MLFKCLVYLREMKLSNILLTAQFLNVFSIQDYRTNSFYDFFLTNVYPDILRKNSKPQEYFIKASVHTVCIYSEYISFLV